LRVSSWGACISCHDFRNEYSASIDIPAANRRQIGRRRAGRTKQFGPERATDFSEVLQSVDGVGPRSVIVQYADNKALRVTLQEIAAP
jgi:hypothetical protein